MAKDQIDFIENLRKIIQNWSQSPIGRTNPWLSYIQLAPDLAHLMVRLSGEPDIPAAQKAKLATAIAYLIAPMDLIPETYWGALGYLDDIVMAATVIQDILNHVDHQTVHKHWENAADLESVITAILQSAEKMLTPEYYQKLLALLAA